MEGSPNLTGSKNTFVYQGLRCDEIMFEGQVDSSKHISLVYDEVERHYHVIANLTGAMAKRYICRACHKSCVQDTTHVCGQTCSDCTASPPCAFSGVRIPCNDCNRHFRSRTCFPNHKHNTAKKKSVCERKRCCATCGRMPDTNVTRYSVRTLSRNGTRVTCAI